MTKDLTEFIQEVILPKIKVCIYVINLDEYHTVGTHWITMDAGKIRVTYLYWSCFGVEYIPK